MESKMDSTQEKMDAWLEEMKARRKETSVYEATKGGLVEAAVYIFDETLNKMDTTELETDRE
jgi:hypothetical protein